MYDTVYNAMVKLMDCNVEKGNSVMFVFIVLKNVLGILLILIIIASFTVSRKIGKKISDSIEQPIDMLVDRFKTLSNGGLDEEFPEYEADDEFAVINQTAKEMADSLKLIINDLCWIMAEMADGNFNVNTKIEDKYVGKYVELKNAIVVACVSLSACVVA
jgi:methyl-accepting chemotaxis protein